jgi:hypothetical protein
MSEWWTYGLSDFLMFSADSYWRLVARHNAAWWPAQLAAAALPLALAAWLRAGSAAAARAQLLVLALAWGWLGWSFHWLRYSEIFLAAPWTAAACAAQALLLALVALAPMRAGLAPVPAAAWVLLALAFCYPLLAPLTGHPIGEAEVFAFMAEPTALATCGVLAGLRQLARRLRALLAVLPVLSLLLGGATRWLLA